ncbi:5'-nucleotidase [compost metagenome]
MKYNHVLFDLDGTLTDPKIGITKSVQYALSKSNIIVENLDELEPFIGPPLATSFREFYGFTEEEAWEAVRNYREYFADTGIFENELYDGIPELLAHLAENGAELIVATSKPQVFAERILKYFGIDSFFSAVVGSGLDGTMSDKSEIIRFILDQYRPVQAETVMIGDRKHDIIGAHNNGIASIGVLYGYGSVDEMEAIRPTYCLKTVRELSDFFDPTKTVELQP